MLENVARIDALTPKFRTIAAKFGHDAFDADDLLSEILTAVWEKATDQDTDAHIITRANWLAKHHVRDLATYDHYCGSQDEIAAGTDEDGEPCDVFELYYDAETKNPEELVIEAEDRSYREASISALPVRQHEVITYVAQGYTNREIAKVLNVTEQAIGKNVGKARLKLEKAFWQQNPLTA